MFSESFMGMDLSMTRLKCAHTKPAQSSGCANNGTLACSSCRLVSYCSKECQKAHWAAHKQDCKDPIRSNAWRAAWVKESRTPSFIGPGITSTEQWLKDLPPIAARLHLWGGLPAMDLLNLKDNEGLNVQRDLSLAFVASGDIRNVIRTINELPVNYQGRINIILNDRDTAMEKSQAVDIALHLWYSLCIPMEYHTKALLKMTQFFLSTTIGVKLGTGRTSAIYDNTTESVRDTFAAILDSKYGLEEATAENSRIRFAPSRVDRHDRRNVMLEPSHRAAVLEFRRFGLLLPYGAQNDKFNYPNKFLFDPSGHWLQDDMSLPLDSWDIPAAVAAGKRHGAHREDIFGCLYFYLTEQLREFSERLSRFHISFHMSNIDAGNLSKAILAGVYPNLDATQRFDRIDVSNILDVNYMGINGTLQSFGPLLADTDTAALIGYFMNWPTTNANANPATNEDIKKSLDVLMDLKRLPQPPLRPSLVELREYSQSILAYHKFYTAVYDNSKPFAEYLRQHGLHAALKASKLRLRGIHTIVPHRLCAPLGAPSSALPAFRDAEDWYLQAHVNGPGWSERFVEFCRATK